MLNKKGFTLLELLIVIAIIAILAVVVFVSLDPLTRFQDARDAQRWSDITALLDAIKLDQLDNGGAYLTSVSALSNASYYTIGTCATGGDSGCTAQTTLEACADLSGLVTNGYLPNIPVDPSTGTDAMTDYYIMKAGNGILKIGACDPEGGTAIEIGK